MLSLYLNELERNRLSILQNCMEWQEDIQKSIQLGANACRRAPTSLSTSRSRPGAFARAWRAFRSALHADEGRRSFGELSPPIGPACGDRLVCGAYLRADAGQKKIIPVGRRRSRARRTEREDGRLVIAILRGLYSVSTQAALILVRKVDPSRRGARADFARVERNLRPKHGRRRSGECTR